MWDIDQWDHNTIFGVYQRKKWTMHLHSERRAIEENVIPVAKNAWLSNATKIKNLCLKFDTTWEGYLFLLMEDSESCKICINNGL